MQKVLSYAKQRGYTRFTSTLQEAWRLSIAGLTASLCQAMDTLGGIPELGPEVDTVQDPLTLFALVEARRHRERGVTLTMFLGLMKYYRQSYLDLLASVPPSAGAGADDRLFIDRCFDRIEVAFCQEWVDIDPADRDQELQQANRFMTNEKNTYLTVFESLSDAVLMLDQQDRLVNLNHAASRLVDPLHVPGGSYYEAAGASVPGEPSAPSRKICIGRAVAELFPWLGPLLGQMREQRESRSEIELSREDSPVHFEVLLSDMLDVSEKYTFSIVVLRDITKQRWTTAQLHQTIANLGEALSEVKRLSGLLPLCASCKKVRDDRGYWHQVEQYITERTGDLVSHSICPECVLKLYPEFAKPALPSADPTHPKSG
jgi:PAS domain-containing protein